MFQQWLFGGVEQLGSRVPSQGCYHFFPMILTSGTKKHMAHSQHLQRPAWPMSCKRFSKRKGSRPRRSPLRLSENVFLEDQREGKAVRTWARNRSFISFCWGMSPRNQTSCPGLDGQLWIQHDLLIAQCTTEPNALQSPFFFRAFLEVILIFCVMAGGKKSVGERVVSAIFGYMIY